MGEPSNGNLGNTRKGKMSIGSKLSYRGNISCRGKLSYKGRLCSRGKTSYRGKEYWV